MRLGSPRAELCRQELPVATNTKPSCLHLDTYLESLPFLEDIRPWFINLWEHSSFVQWLAKWPSFRVWSVLGPERVQGPQPPRSQAWSPGMGGSGTCTSASHHRARRSPDAGCRGPAQGPALRRGGRVTSEGGTARNTASPFFLPFSRTLAMSALGKPARAPLRHSRLLLGNYQTAASGGHGVASVDCQHNRGCVSVRK